MVAGQATVEVVLVIPVVVALTLVVVQAGVVVRDRLLVVHAGREAARAAAVDPSVATASAAARRATGLADDRLTVSVAGASGAPGDRLTVTVRYRVPTTVPLVGSLVPDLVVQTTVTARIE
jgi:Flp pilus assembly protein TadG